MLLRLVSSGRVVLVIGRGVYISLRVFLVWDVSSKIENRSMIFGFVVGLGGDGV